MRQGKTWVRMDSAGARFLDPLSTWSIAATASAARRGSAEPNLDLVTDNPHLVGLQVLGRRRVEHLSGANVEARGMQRTLDHLAVEPAVGQAGIGVGANIVRRKKATIGSV